MKIKTKLLLFMGVSSIILVILYTWTDIRWKGVSSHTQVVNLEWENAAGFSSTKEPIHYKVTDKAQDKYFNMHFSFKANSNDKYPNIFQTSNSNAGVRLELGKPSILAFIIGHIPFVVTTDLTLGVWHEVSINITPLNHIQIFFDKELIIDQSRKLHYKINDIAIGSGFSETRPFNGEIKLHTLSYGFMERNKSLINAFAAWLLLTIIVFVVILKGPAIRLSKVIFNDLKLTFSRQSISTMWLRLLDKQEKIVLSATVIIIGSITLFALFQLCLTFLEAWY